MKILLVTAHPYIPQIAGGAQSSMNDLAIEFIRRGHNVAVLAGLTGRGWLGLSRRALLKVLPRKYAVDRGLGYPVYRSWFVWDVAAEVATEFQANVIILQSGFPVKIAKALKYHKARRLIYLRNVEMDDLGGDILDLENVSYIANSCFTARRFYETKGINAEVVYPIVRRQNYEVVSSKENVTFINPVPVKGLDIALQVAEHCPDIPFVFVEAWGLDEEIRRKLSERLAVLPNVTLQPPTRDMKSVYGKAKIVIAPSQWEEAFGRVAVEPQFSGIPVVASARGGLPEAVGPGGILVPADAGPDAWVQAVRSLWDDRDLYDRTSRAARAHSQRPEMDPAAQVDHLLRIFANHGTSQSGC